MIWGRILLEQKILRPEISKLTQSYSKYADCRIPQRSCGFMDLKMESVRRTLLPIHTFLLHYFSNFRAVRKIGKAITTISNCPEKISYCFFHFPTWKTRGLRCFSLNSRVILKLFEAKPRTISILPENLMKNIEIHVFSMLENEKNSRKIFLDSYRLLDITF